MLAFAACARRGHEHHLRTLSVAPGVEGPADVRAARSERPDDRDPINRAFRQGLVTQQTAISLLLLISAGLFGKTLLNLTQGRPGYSHGSSPHLLADPEAERLLGGTNGAALSRSPERLAALPGVTSATGARVPAIAGSNSSGNMTVEGFTPKGDGDDNSASTRLDPTISGRWGFP
jgi:hypothetical protein